MSLSRPHDAVAYAWPADGDHDQDPDWEGTLRIGCLWPMSGRAARYGQDAIIGADMAAEEVNQAGGVLGREIRLYFSDDRSDPTYAVRLAQRYIDHDRVHFLTGIVSSAVALAVTRVAYERKVVFVGADHASSRLTLDDFHPYYFRVTNNTMQSMRAGALYLADKPIRTWAFIGPDYEYGHRQFAEFRTYFSQLRPDTRLVGALWPKLYAPTYREYLEQLQAWRPDVVIHGFWGGDSVAFVRELVKTRILETTEMMSFDAGGNFDVFEGLGPEMPTGLVLGARHHNNFPDTPANRAFVQRFFERAHRYPSYTAHGAYVGIHFIAAVVNYVGSLDPDDFRQGAEGFVLETPRDLPGRPSVMRAIDHQMVQDIYLGKTGPQAGFAPARVMITDWTVIPAEKVLPTPDEVENRRRAGTLRAEG
ncbi:MAG TPA: ABC transporter substrate-binding protein [Limnochordales bacterium]|nr:ABC transporter substrate-binding protein [Limnochordales bacterium]